MLGIFNFITGGSRVGDEQKPVEFLLFPELPTELRLKIWRCALPERVIGASLHFENDTWSCAHSATAIHTSNGRPDPRCLPVLFQVNHEAREVCLGDYVKFAQTYIHPTFDLLCITWYREPQFKAKFYPITGHPLVSFKQVAISVAHNESFDTRFGALVDCLQKLGSPEKLLLSLAGPNLPSVQSISTGYSVSSGNTVAILDWPRNPDRNREYLDTTKILRTSVSSAFEDAQQHSMSKIPVMDQQLCYIFDEYLS